MLNGESLDDASRPKQTNVRLSTAALDHLATVKRYYGLRSTTAVLTFLLGEAVRRINAQPKQPVVLPSVELDEDEIEVERFGRQVAQQNRIDQQRAESR
jgi:hypothetical protein